MTAFPFAHAGVTNDGPITSWMGWRDLLERCLDQLGTSARGIGLLYVTDPLAEAISEILETLRTRTGLDTWRGAVAPAICATGAEYFDTPAMALLILDVPESAAAVFPGEPGANDLQVANHALLAIVHADPRAPTVLEAMPELAQSTGAYLVGGLTSGNAATPLIGAPDAPSGLAGVLLTDAVPVATGLTQGCSPIGQTHTITGMEDRVVTELDGRNALEVLKEDVGELLARDLRRLAGYVHAAFPGSGSDTADYLVRNLVGFNVEQGWIGVAEDLNPGDRPDVCPPGCRERGRGYAAHARRCETPRRGQSPRRGLSQLRRARAASVRAGARELSMVAETFGDIPVVGFFGNGEISHDRLYTYTGVLTVFPEPTDGTAA